MISLFFIFNLKIKTKIKIFSVIFFILFALPYIYLIYLWGSIIPTSAAQARGVGFSFHPFNLGFCLSIIAFYIFPFFQFKKLNKTFIEKKLNLRTLTIFVLFLIYMCLIFLFGDYENLRIEGKGVFHKLLIIFFDDSGIRLFFTFILFLISFILVINFFKTRNDILILIYFLILSILTFPLLPKYLDPFLFILFFTFFKIKPYLNHNKIYFW